MSNMRHDEATLRPTTADRHGGEPNARVSPPDSVESLLGAAASFAAPVVSPLVLGLRAIVTVALITGLLAFGLSFLIPVEYRSKESFFVEKSSKGLDLPAGLAGLGRQLGLTDASGGQSLEFYAWLATSTPVLRTTLLDTLPSPLRESPEAPPIAWSALLSPPSLLDSVAVSRAIERLKDKIDTKVDEQTSLVTVTVSARSPGLAMWFADKLFEGLNRANTVTRQTTAGNELAFLGEQQRVAADSLSEAELNLTHFYEQNRQYQDSPILTFKHERLRREVDLQRDRYLALSRSVQDAQVRAVQGIPALTRIEGPTFPSRKSRPRRLLVTFASMLVAIALGYTYFVWKGRHAATSIAPR